MNTRQKLIPIALASITLLASSVAIAQTTGGSPSANGGAGGNNGATAQGSDQAQGSGSGGSKTGSLMQKRQKGMSAGHAASSPAATGKMTQ